MHMSREDSRGYNNKRRLRAPGTAGCGSQHQNLSPGGWQQRPWLVREVGAARLSESGAHPCYICINMNSLSWEPGQRLLVLRQ